MCEHNGNYEVKGKKLIYYSCWFAFGLVVNVGVSNYVQ